MCLAHYKQVAYKLEESSMTINFSIPIYKQANEMHCLQNNANLTQKSLCLTQLVHLWPVFACSVLITVAFSPTKCFPGFIFPGWIHPGDCNVHKSYSTAWHRVHFHGTMTSIGKESPFVAVILMAACPVLCWYNYTAPDGGMLVTAITGINQTLYYLTRSVPWLESKSFYLSLWCGCKECKCC